MIKPTCCPHCKERLMTELVRRYLNSNQKPQMVWFVECQFCGVRGPYMRTFEGAISAYNEIADAVENGRFATSEPTQRINNARDYLVAVVDDDEIPEVVNSLLELLGFDSDGGSS